MVLDADSGKPILSQMRDRFKDTSSSRVHSQGLRWTERKTKQDMTEIATQDTPAHLPGDIKSVRQAIHRGRRKTHPKSPKSREETHEALDQDKMHYRSQWLNGVRRPIRANPFWARWEIDSTTIYQWRRHSRFYASELTAILLKIPPTIPHIQP